MKSVATILKRDPEHLAQPRRQPVQLRVGGKESCARSLLVPPLEITRRSTKLSDQRVLWHLSSEDDHGMHEVPHRLNCYIENFMRGPLLGCDMNVQVRLRWESEA